MQMRRAVGRSAVSRVAVAGVAVVEDDAHRHSDVEGPPRRRLGAVVRERRGPDAVDVLDARRNVTAPAARFSWRSSIRRRVSTTATFSSSVTP
jgi:hypothetical protein